MAGSVSIIQAKMRDAHHLRILEDGIPLSRRMCLVSKAELSRGGVFSGTGAGRGFLCVRVRYL